MELNYKQSGVGEPLIIMHGLFGMLDNWQSFANYFSSSFEVFNIDLRNHGKSPHSDEFDYMVMAKDIHDFMLDQNIFYANIIGHSMGGKTAMQFASIFPGFVKKLIVVDIFPKKYPEEFHSEHMGILRSAKIIADKKYTDRKSAETELSKHINDLRTYMFLLKNIKKNEDGTYGWKFNLEAITDNLVSLLGNIIISEPINIPVLFIKGEKSNYITAEDIKSAGKYFTDYRIVTIPNAGHWVHVDNVEAFNKAVEDFL